jgi:hypothetical protein
MRGGGEVNDICWGGDGRRVFCSVSFAAEGINFPKERVLLPMMKIHPFHRPVLI